MCSSALSFLMDPWGLRVTQNAYFSLLTHTKQLLLVTFCDTTAEIGSDKERLDGRTPYGQADMRVEIVI